tara:strand:+ start:231 stop:695 length:465 start_codon:yes stop_codon:yes gene_type:complete
MKGYYLDTENLPLHNWRMVNDKNDVSYLRIDKTVGDEINDSKAWDIVLDTYYSEFGLSEDYEIILDLKMDLALVQNDFAISGDNFLQNKIRHLTDQVQELVERPVDGDLNSAINAISKWQGYRINQKEVSTNEFMYLMRDFKLEIDTLKQKNNG